MEEHPHIGIGRQLWRAVALADADVIYRLLSPDIVWHNKSSGNLPSTVRGPEGVIDMLAGAGESVDSLTSKLIDIFANDRGVVLYYSMQATREAVSLETRMLLMMTIWGGRVVEATAVPVDPEPLDRFWSYH